MLFDFNKINLKKHKKLSHFNLFNQCRKGLDLLQYDFIFPKNIKFWLSTFLFLFSMKYTNNTILNIVASFGQGIVKETIDNSPDSLQINIAITSFILIEVLSILIRIELGRSTKRGQGYYCALDNLFASFLIHSLLGCIICLGTMFLPLGRNCLIYLIFRVSSYTNKQINKCETF